MPIEPKDHREYQQFFKHQADILEHLAEALPDIRKEFIERYRGKNT